MYPSSLAFLEQQGLKQNRKFKRLFKSFKKDFSHNFTYFFSKIGEAGWPPASMCAMTYTWEINEILALTPFQI